ncbi:MAG: site-specific integrase [Actinomycetes bacterium]
MAAARTVRKRRPRGTGKVRQLPSGRWQAKIPGPDGVYHPAPETFDTRMDAEGWLAGQVTDLDIGTWSPPKAKTKSGTLADFSKEWLSTKADLRPRVRVEYQRDLDNRILPDLGDVPVNRIDTAIVRRWYSKQGDEFPSARAHAYATLHNILGAAMDEGLRDDNPCRIKGATKSKQQKKVRPATLTEVGVMADHMPDRRKAMLLIAAWCGPRFGELTELRRDDIDLDGGVIRIERGVVKVKGGFIVGETKSDAGVRDVAFPPHLMDVITGHLATHVGPEGDALLFPSSRDPKRHLSESTLEKSWYPAREAAGRPDLRWHDLRHTGATLAAATGATLADLMARLGHSTVGAAMIYQHAVQGRDKVLAERLSEIALGGEV